MYRSRPGGSIDREILNYLSSLKDDFAILFYDIIGSEAHMIMLHEIGYLSREELGAILKILEEAKLHPEPVMKKNPTEYRYGGPRDLGADRRRRRPSSAFAWPASSLA
jgi:argininosuccinate lyase